MQIINSFIPIALAISALAAQASPANPKAVDSQFISGKIDLEKNQITLPLHRGQLADGRKVYFVLTNASDAPVAHDLGLGFAPSLALADGVAGTRSATQGDDGTWTFASGAVDFAPERKVAPGDAPDAFPPKEAHAGATGDSNYSPYVSVNLGANGGDKRVVFSAPIVAFGVEPSQIEFAEGAVDYRLVHDKVVSIDPAHGEVTLKLTPGYAAGRSLVYLSFDANVEVAAAMEGAVLAPALENLKGKGVSLDIYALANGATGANNPDRQGFNSALMGEGSPLNILEGLPTVQDGYSPLWDLNIGVFTADAIAQGYRKLITSEVGITDLVNQHRLTGPGGKAFGPSGIEINCPVVATLQ